MKTTKEKPAGKPKKTPAAAKTVRKKKETGTKIVPSEDQIREKAGEIYYERISRGEHGTPEGDWREAEELLKGS